MAPEPKGGSPAGRGCRAGPGLGAPSTWCADVGDGRIMQTSLPLRHRHNAVPQWDIVERGRFNLMQSALAATFGMLALAWYLKAPCRDPEAWNFQKQWRAGCYNDIWALYGARELHDKWPYLEAFNEYPPVTAAWQALLGRMAEDAGMFWEMNAVLLALLALGTTAWLLRGGVGENVWAWALGPPLIFYSFHNWDLLAVLPATVGVVLWMRGRVGWAGAFIALAACAKWYPAILLPVMGMELIRREKGLGRQGWTFGLAAVGVLVAINLPIYLITPDGFLEPYRFHAERTATFESHWFAIRHYMIRWEVGGVGALDALADAGLVLLGLLAGALAFAVWRGRLEVVAAGALAIVGWLVVSPVLSMQYALWIIPPVLLAGLPARRLMPFLLTDVLVFTMVWRFFEGGRGFDKDYEPLALASMLRLLALLGLCWWLLRHGLATSPHAMARQDGARRGLPSDPPALDPVQQPITPPDG